MSNAKTSISHVGLFLVLWAMVFIGLKMIASCFSNVDETWKLLSLMLLSAMIVLCAVKFENHK